MTSPGALSSVSGPVRSSTSDEKKLMKRTTESPVQITPIAPATQNQATLGRSCEAGMYGGGGFSGGGGGAGVASGLGGGGGDGGCAVKSGPAGPSLMLQPALVLVSARPRDGADRRGYAPTRYVEKPRDRRKAGLLVAEVLEGVEERENGRGDQRDRPDRPGDPVPGPAGGGAGRIDVRKAPAGRGSVRAFQGSAGSRQAEGEAAAVGEARHCSPTVPSRPPPQRWARSVSRRCSATFSDRSTLTSRMIGRSPDASRSSSLSTRRCSISYSAAIRSTSSEARRPPAATRTHAVEGRGPEAGTRRSHRPSCRARRSAPATPPRAARRGQFMS